MERILREILGGRMGMGGIPGLEEFMSMGAEAELKSATLIAAEAKAVGKDSEISYLREAVSQFSSVLEKTKATHAEEIRSFEQRLSTASERLSEAVVKRRQAQENLAEKDDLLASIQEMLKSRTENLGANAKRQTLLAIIDDLKQLVSAAE